MVAAILRGEGVEIPLCAVDGDLLDVVDQRHVSGLQPRIDSQRQDMLCHGIHGEDVRAAYIGAGKRPETIEDQQKIDQLDANARVTNLAGLSTVAMFPLAGEFTTYGLAGGLGRVAGGFAGSALGSYGLGKVGEFGDRTFGTK